MSPSRITQLEADSHRRGSGRHLRPDLTMKFISCLFIVLMINGCAGRQSALDPAGPQANRINHLWWFMFWVSLGVFVLVMAALYFAVRQGRRRSQSATDAQEVARPELATEPESDRRMSKAVGASVALTIVILFVILLFEYATSRTLQSLTAREPVTIELVGHQWWWSVKYADSNASRTVTTANEIHLPAGQPILLKGTSTDVIHSFWVPNLHGKKDLIPGQQTVTWLQADRPGVYRGQCAEFCGYQHAKMALVVVVESPEDFTAWLDNQLSASVQPQAAEAQRGQQIFLTSTCVMCHTIRGTSAGSGFGPELTHLASRATIAGGTLPNTRENLGEWITRSQEIKPGNHMPPVPLKPDDLQAVLTYLESLK